ncbi:hypothetical protein B0H13DRAFT_1516167, partial [Mycena leptocephala]
FPPIAPSRKLRHEIITGMYEDADPSQLQESGCAVCGQLTPNVELTRMHELELN